MERMQSFVRRVGFVAFVSLSLAISSALGVEITFNKTFIEADKNRATLTLPDFEVTGTHKKAKSIDDTGKKSGNDGDIHCAGWSPTLGFALVAEISNVGNDRCSCCLLCLGNGVTEHALR